MYLFNLQFRRKLQSIAVVMMGFLLFILSVMVLMTGSYNPPAPRLEPISSEEASRQLDMAPVYLDEERIEDGRTRPVFRSTNDSNQSVPAYQ